MNCHSIVLKRFSDKVLAVKSCLFFTHFFQRTIRGKCNAVVLACQRETCWKGVAVSIYFLLKMAIGVIPPAKLKEENRLLMPLPRIWSWAISSEKKQKRSCFDSFEDNFPRLLCLIFAQQCLSAWLYLNSWGCELFFRLTPCTGFSPLSVPPFLSVSFFSSNKTLLSSLAEITGGGVMRYICFPVLSYLARREMQFIIESTQETVVEWGTVWVIDGTREKAPS